jgi:hypothetical protein
MKKVLFILLVPVEIAFLFLLSYFTNGFLNDNLIQAYLLLYSEKYSTQILLHSF